MATWQPQYLNFKVSNKSHQAIDADYWNALWNTLIAQADNNTAGVKEIFDTFVSGVKGNAEAEYRHGDVNITKADIGLGNVDNTADIDKYVAHAVNADHALAADNSIEATHALAADNSTEATHALAADLATEAGAITSSGFLPLVADIVDKFNEDYNFEEVISTGIAPSPATPYTLITNAQIDALFA